MPLHRRAASRLSVLPALSKEAGGGGKAAAEVFAIWAHIQAGWQPPDLRSPPYVWGSPSFNVDCASQILSGAGLWEDPLHLLSLGVPRDICHCENLSWCLLLPDAFPACSPDNVWVSLCCPTPGSLQSGNASCAEIRGVVLLAAVSALRSEKPEREWQGHLAPFGLRRKT